MDAAETLLLGTFQRQDGQPCYAKAQSGQLNKIPSTHGYIMRTLKKVQNDYDYVRTDLSCTWFGTVEYEGGLQN